MVLDNLYSSLSWTNRRRVDNIKRRTSSLSAWIKKWFSFYKKEITSDIGKVKTKLSSSKNKTVMVNRDKKQTIFFESKQYIGLTYDKGIITLISKPPTNLIEEAKKMNTTVVEIQQHGKDCTCVDCMNIFMQDLTKVMTQRNKNE